MRILIAGGGTGGHIFPAISIAEEIIRRDHKNEVLFVGSQNHLEKELISARGFNVEFVRSGGIVGKSIFTKLKSITGSLLGVADSNRIIRRFSPDVVVGVGGYVSGPVVLSAFLRSLPTAICEQNSVPGLTNRILSRMANRIFLTFEDSMSYFPAHKTVVTGNPLRSEFLKEYIPFEDDSEKYDFRILITGGSQGAKGINTVIPESFRYLKSGRRLKIVHQTGASDADKVKRIYTEIGIDAEVYPFIDNIAEFYRESDLIISRAGAGAISEITALGKPSVLIPYPYAANNHQYMNAKYVEQKGASVTVEENNLSHMLFPSLLDKILEREELSRMSQCSGKLGKPQAAEKVVNNLYEMAGQG